MIGDDIQIIVLEPRYVGHQVRLGIEAPAHLSVHREEIYKIIQEEKNAID